MARYMAHCLNMLEREPIQIFGWPLFLPVCIARDYYSLWTRERMQAIVAAANARTIAIEINDMAHTPDERFIRMARERGLKFTFGSDSRNANAGRLAYCKAVARKCGLEPGGLLRPPQEDSNAPCPLTRHHPPPGRRLSRELSRDGRPPRRSSRPPLRRPTAPGR